MVLAFPGVRKRTVICENGHRLPQERDSVFLKLTEKAGLSVSLFGIPSAYSEVMDIARPDIKRRKIRRNIALAGLALLVIAGLKPGGLPTRPAAPSVQPEHGVDRHGETGPDAAASAWPGQLWSREETGCAYPRADRSYRHPHPGAARRPGEAGNRADGTGRPGVRTASDGCGSGA